MSTKYSQSKEIHVLVKELVHNGWAFKRGGKHGRLLPPNGQPPLTVPGSPSDRRAILNFQRDIRHRLSAYLTSPSSAVFLTA